MRKRASAQTPSWVEATAARCALVFCVGSKLFAASVFVHKVVECTKHADNIEYTCTESKRLAKEGRAESECDGKGARGYLCCGNGVDGGRAFSGWRATGAGLRSYGDFVCIML